MNFLDTLEAGQTMICTNNYLADILRVCDIKDFVWYWVFKVLLIYFLSNEDSSKPSLLAYKKHVHVDEN